MNRDLLKQVILEQREYTLPEDYIPRTLFRKIKPLLSNELILIITGLRRTGKSILLRNIQQINKQSDYYLNFDDDRLVNFELSDFEIAVCRRGNDDFIAWFFNQKPFCISFGQCLSLIS